MIFVFGSNLSGIHGAGAARYALENEGAIWGNGIGRQGNSYAIPTKGFNISNQPPEFCKPYVDQFIDYAKLYSELNFKVTCIGCGLAGNSHEDIAPYFKDAPSNCYFDFKWAEYLPNGVRFWGSG